MQSNEYPFLQRALNWAANAVRPEAEVIAANRLQGGVTSLMLEVVLQAGGTRQTVVMRLIDSAEWLSNQPDLARHEAEALRLAANNAGVPTPRLLAFDEHGGESGMPAVLMTRLAGAAELTPPDMDRWLDEMARAIAAVHEVEPGDFPRAYYRYCDASQLDTSSWSRHPDLWRAAAAIVTAPAPEAPKRFIHRDYHPTNILWSDGRVSGIVDWINGCVGPAGIDVGHCRVNLAQLHGLPAAEAFLAAYRRHAGEAFTYDPYWDIVSLIDYAFWEPDVYGGWTDLGVTGLTKELIVERLDAYLLQLLDLTSKYAQEGAPNP